MLDSSARAIRDQIAAGKVSAVEVCRAFLERIEQVNPTLNAFNLVAADRALARADDLDRRRAKGESVELQVRISDEDRSRFLALP